MIFSIRQSNMLTTPQFDPENLLVVIFNDHGGVRGGADQVAFQSALGLRGLGVNVCVFSGETLDDGWQQSFSEAGVSWISCEQVINPGVDRRGFWNGKAYKLALKALKEVPESVTPIAHYHSVSKLLSSSVIKAAMKADCPAFLTLHNYLAFCPNGIYFDFPKNKSCELEPFSIACICRNCDRKNRVHKILRLARFSLNRRSGFSIDNSRINYISVSKTSAELCLRVTGVSPAVVHNPVNLKQMTKANVIENRGLVYVGRISPEKGVLILAKACRDAGFDLTIVGEGEAKEEVLSINPDVRITGWLSEAGVIEEIRRARALVLPSLCYETFGLVVPEALANGIPVIVSSRVGAKYMVAEGVNGFVWDAAKPDKLSELVARFSEDSLIIKMSKAAYERYWVAPLVAPAHASELLSLYKTKITARLIPNLIDRNR